MVHAKSPMAKQESTLHSQKFIIFVVYVRNYQTYLIVYDIRTPSIQIECSARTETRSVKVRMLSASPSTPLHPASSCSHCKNHDYAEGSCDSSSFGIIEM